MGLGRFLAGAALAIGISTHAMASMLLSGELESVTTGKKEPISISITPSKMKIDNGRVAVIFVPKEKIAIILLPRQRKYIELALDDAPEDKTSAAHRPHPSITKTDKTDKVGGWTCQQLHVTEPQAPDQDLCVASVSDIGITDEDLDVFRRYNRISQRMEGLHTATGRIMSMEDEIKQQTGIDGFAVRTISYNNKGKPDEITTYTTVEHKRISAKAFEIPVGYTRVEREEKSSPPSYLK
jgi:hypothetical protein